MTEREKRIMDMIFGPEDTGDTLYQESMDQKLCPILMLAKATARHKADTTHDPLTPAWCPRSACMLWDAGNNTCGLKNNS